MYIVYVNVNIYVYEWIHYYYYYYIQLKFQYAGALKFEECIRGLFQLIIQISSNPIKNKFNKFKEKLNVIISDGNISQLHMKYVTNAEAISLIGLRTDINLNNLM